MEYNTKENIVKNINILMNFWGLNVDKLSKESGLSVSGIYKSLKEGSFKIESLEKIAETLKVPTFVLLCDEVSPERKRKGGSESIVIHWKINELTSFQVLNDGDSLTTMFVMNDDYIRYQEDYIAELESKIENLKFDIKSQELNIKNLKELNKAYKEQADAFKYLSRQVTEKWKQEAENPDQEKE